MGLTFLIFATGVFFGTWYERLPERIRILLGHTPQHITSGVWDRVFSSLPITGEPSHLYASLVMTLLCVGWLESNRRWAIALAVFFGSHLITVIVEGLLLVQLNRNSTHWLLTSYDVGPSAGYYGCLGACLFALRPPIRSRAIMSLLAYLGARLLFGILFNSHVAVDIRSDLAHLIAVMAGYLLASIFLRHDTSLVGRDKSNHAIESTETDRVH